MDGLVNVVVVGVLSSLVASVVWLLAVRQVRPKIDISPQIAEGEQLGVEGFFRIKIINRRRRAATNLKFEFTLLIPRQMKNGLVRTRQLIEVLNTPPLILPGRRRDNDDDNAFRIRIGENLRQFLDSNPSSILRFRVYANDEVSGMGKVFEMKFHDSRADIVQGTFSKGQEFEIY